MKNQILILLMMVSSAVFSQVPPDPPLFTGEYYTGLYSVSYDYQSPGSLRYVVQDPVNSGNLCAITMAQHDSTTSAGTNRHIYYSYSTNRGLNWTPDVITEVSSQGFPCISLSNGIPVISASQSGTGMKVWKDISFGGGSFSELPGIPSALSLWGMISGTSNGNIVLTAANINVQQINYSTYTNNTWNGAVNLPLLNGPSGSYTVAAGSNGTVGIFGSNNNDFKIYYYKSTDNGISFDNGTLIFENYISGTDTLYAGSGLQAVYTEGNIPHLVFTVFNTENYVFPNQYTSAFVSPMILHWSSATGITEVAGDFNIPDITDTITNVSVAPLCQPSIGVFPNGKLICSFTAYLKNHTQTVDNGDVLNAGDIFFITSNNNGNTWEYPFNITNTPNIEEKNSCIPPSSHSIDPVFYFQRDMKAGSWVHNAAWGKAPVYGIYYIFPYLGIQETGSEPGSFILYQNYPNPFNPSTDIEFSLNKSGLTKLVVYDTRGREIAQLVNEVLSEGSYTYSFDTGKYNLPSGVYFYKITSGENSKVKKMMLVR